MNWNEWAREEVTSKLIAHLNGHVKLSVSEKAKIECELKWKE